MIEGLGPRLKQRREQLGLTLREVEQITENSLSNAYLSQLENGKIKKPSAHVLLILGAAYHISMNEMLAWLGEAPTFTVPPLCPTCGRANFVTDPAPQPKEQGNG